MLEKELDYINFIFSDEEMKKHFDEVNNRHKNLKISDKNLNTIIQNGKNLKKLNNTLFGDDNFHEVVNFKNNTKKTIEKNQLTFF